MDQEKTTFTCPLRTYAYRQMPFDLYNAPATFQRCMLAIFHDMIEGSVEVFMDDFSVFRNSFDNCLNNLDKMLQRCKDENLVLNWEKCHFMVKEGIVLGHKVSCEFAVGAVLGKKDGKHFHPIYSARKTLNAAQQKYIVTEKELMVGTKIQTYSITSKTRIKITSKQDFKRNSTRDTSKSAINHQTIPLSLHLKMILENVNNNVGELVGLTLNPKAVPILQQWTIVLYDSEYMQTTLASPLTNNHMSLTHLKGLPAGALKLGQDHTQTWVGVPIRSNNHTNTG
ncbi:retrovirus-related pol polyprotein from transposon 17.6 [Tanacetum coccineum]